jgi:arsenate reductase
MYPELTATIKSLPVTEISSDRKAILQQLIDYIKSKQVNHEPAKLNFICTHNSRRSQLAQVWAQTAAYYNKTDVESFSGGVEVTEFNRNAIEALENAGFAATRNDKVNPHYMISCSSGTEGIIAFSKLYDDAVNPTSGFAAVMTCSDADENCPFISGTEARIPLLYDDPKEYDNSPLMAEKYQERSRQIATEMFYVFSQRNA